MPIDEERVPQTRDRALLMHSALERRPYPRGTDALLLANRGSQPLRPAIGTGAVHLLHMICNGGLGAGDPAEVAGALPVGIAERHRDLRECSGCRRVCWRGSHFRRLEAIVSRISGEAGDIANRNAGVGSCPWRR